MRTPIGFITTVAAILVLPAVGVAQERPIELGLDAGLDYKVNSPTFTNIAVPVPQFRVGFGLSDRVTLEPRLAFNYIKPEGSDATWSLGLGAGVLFHLNQVRQGVYLRPYGEWFHIDAGGASASQFAAGGGLGYKTGSGRVIGRFEGGYAHFFENDDFDSSDDLVLLLGFSIFTK